MSGFVKTTIMQSPSPVINPYTFVAENEDGCAIVPTARVFRWGLELRVGSDSDRRCSAYDFGFLQNITAYRATARWENGTTWLWYIPNLPVRDFVPPDKTPPWYSPDLRFVVDKCGGTTHPYFEDTPNLVAGDFPSQKGKHSPDAIPWSDPRTGKGFLKEILWSAAFDVFLVGRERGNGGRFNSIGGLGWSLQVVVGVDMKQPAGKRATIQDPNNVIYHQGVRSKPIFDKSPRAAIKTQAYSSFVDADRAHR